MERIIRFGLLVGINLIMAAVVILLANGEPFKSMQGMKGIGLLVLIVIVIGGIAWMGVAALTGGPVPMKTALPLSIGFAVASVVIVILAMGVGREWLRPVLDPFRHSGIWWPLVVIAVSAGEFFGLGIGRARRR